jgi:hypothetical protein
MGSQLANAEYFFRRLSPSVDIKVVRIQEQLFQAKNVGVSEKSQIALIHSSQITGPATLQMCWCALHPSRRKIRASFQIIEPGGTPVYFKWRYNFC